METVVVIAVLVDLVTLAALISKIGKSLYCFKRLSV